MRRKLLLLSITLCMGSSLLLTSVRADDNDYRRLTTTNLLDFKDRVNVSDLLHSKVLDQARQKVGELEDIVLDPNSGRIQFAVLKLSGDLADHGKYAPVPISLLNLSDVSAKKDLFGHRDLTLRIDRDKLLSASKFNVKDWPDRERVVVWGPDIYTFYGVPVETSARGSSTIIETDQGAGSSVIRDRELYHDEYRSLDRNTNNPIDNGTGPDGKDTFRFTPRPWPYNQYPDSQKE